MTLRNYDDSSKKRESKAILILLLFRHLESGQKITKSAFCEDYGLSARSFERCLAEIRCYLAEEEPYLEIRYDRGADGYGLAKPI